MSVAKLKPLLNYINRHRITVGYSLVLIYCLWPTRFADRYESIPADQIASVLVPRTTTNISMQRNPLCSYNDILSENQYMYKKPYTIDVIHNTEIQLGGEYFPKDCTAQFSTAIVVIYRQRERQLNQFLIYMHNFLRKQKIHYRIFIIEQFDQLPFNRAKLFNIGYIYAKKYDFPCLILHDVDLMPLHLGQLYACAQQPRHMCASLDEFRYNLPYRGLFGGAVAIQTEQFSHVNGFSNMFHGWGGEDDDLFERLKASNIDICRFPPQYSQYAMLKHAKEEPNKDRYEYLRNGYMRFHSDGLNSLVYQEKDFKLHNLFTHVLVET